MRLEIETSGANVALSHAASRCTRVRSSCQTLRIILAGLYLLGCSLPALSAEDYLSELDAEAKKVEGTPIDLTAEPDSAEAPPAESSSRPRTDEALDASRKAFERQLKEHYLGSYGFYKKLPERSREEVFQEYRQGADIDKLRKKIIDRLLQH